MDDKLWTDRGAAEKAWKEKPAQSVEHSFDVFLRGFEAGLAHARANPDTVPDSPWTAIETCPWVEETDGDEPLGCYDTSCGKHFQCEYDGIVENGFLFCAFCGGKIVLESAPTDSEIEVSDESV